MSDLTFLIEFINPIIMGICLLSGYALKHAFDKFSNKYIPLVALCMGTAIAVIINKNDVISAEIILGGMMSGLSSTGLYEMLRNLLNFENGN